MTNYAPPIKALLFSIAFLVFASNAQAVNKCTDVNGRVSYSDVPCAQGISSIKPAQVPSANTTTQVNTVTANAGALASAFSKYASAVKSGDLGSCLTTLSQQFRAKVEPAGEKGLMMLRMALPYSLIYGNEEISPSGDKGVLKVKGMAKSFISSGQDQMTYGTIEFVKEAGAWKISRQSWSGNEDSYAGQAQQEMQKSQQESCAGVVGKPESLPEQDMMKLLPGETQIAKFALSPKTRKDISFSASVSQRIMYRVALNNALRCKYKNNYPTGMSVDGKQWLYSFAAGIRVEPVNGSVKLALKNDADEEINFIVVVRQ